MNQTNAQKIVFKIVAIILFLLNPFLLMAQEHKITIQEKNISIENAFIQIEKQTDYSIAYDRSKIDLDKKVSLSLKDASLAKVFSEILKNTGLTYKTNGYHIILIPKKKIETKHTKLTQIIRGVVTDGASGQPIPYATVVLLNTKPYRGNITDSLGIFHFDKVNIGRHDIEVSTMGYEPTIIKEILLTSAKESYHEIRLKQRVLELDEIVVRPTINKEEPINSMALTGGRMISVEETSRFAGGFDDPARLVSSFAGVAGGTATTGLSIHGNSPQFLQWRLEGVEIPNPAHFANMSGVGGGLYTAFSSQVMGNSDFFSGAFPAEYSNAISGVFDMSMRNGNNQNHEHTFQVALLGVDIASEGPLGKKNKNSYIFNYRYFNTAPIKDLVGGLLTNFHDLSFKLNFPTRKAGTFSIWGFGLVDDFTQRSNEDKTEWKESGDVQDQTLGSRKAATGFGHKIFVNENTYIKSSLSATYTDAIQDVDMIEDKEPYNVIPVVDIFDSNWDISFNTLLNTKFGAHHTNRTGVSVTGLFYDLDYNISQSYVSDIITPDITPMKQIVNGGNSSLMASVFSNSLINITDRLSANIGITSQFFALNSNWTLEPRVSFKYKLASSHSLALAYGLHSRREKIDYYYVKTAETGDKLINKDLTFTKAHNLVLSYNWSITDNIHLRVEPYYQYLYDVPVEAESSFSIINHYLFYIDKALVNKGKGRNYGVDITLERYLNKGYYWLLTGSIFDSKYTGGDGVWRNTRYNRKFIVNALIGKEWECGKQKQNIFSANVGMLYQGGEYDTPIDIEASESEQNTVHDLKNAYSVQYPRTLTIDFTIGYKINRKKISHEFSLKILNVTGVTEQYGYYYDLETKREMRSENPAIIPNISYKIHF